MRKEVKTWIYRQLINYIDLINHSAQMNLWTCMDHSVITIPYKLTSVNKNRSWLNILVLAFYIYLEHLIDEIPTQKYSFTLPMAKAFPKYVGRNSNPVSVPEVSTDLCIPCFFYTVMTADNAAEHHWSYILLFNKPVQRIYSSWFTSGLCCLFSGGILENTVNWIFQSLLICRICHL